MESQRFIGKLNKKEKPMIEMTNPNPDENKR